MWRVYAEGVRAAAAQARELARMERIDANLRMIKILEAILIIASVVMIFAFRGRATVTAVGLGLLVQAALMLAFDSPRPG